MEPGGVNTKRMRPAYWYVSLLIVVFFYIYLTAIQLVRGQDLPFKYHHYDEMTSVLKDISSTYTNLTALYSVGQSVQGRELWVIVVSSSPFEHMLGKPEVKYVGNIHGNEPVGREILLHFILFLVRNYHHDPYVRWLMDNTRIHLMPSMNPDGFEVAQQGQCAGGKGRYNARGYDLNRNFPDYFRENQVVRQVETVAVQEWIQNAKFVLSANLHGGALVASFPFDNNPNSIMNQFMSSASLTPDDDVFRHLAQVYSFNHGSMHLGISCLPMGTRFINGTTNGAEWYPLTGGMQDYNYIWGSCMEITLEISCCKYPTANQLPKFWEENVKSLLMYLGEAHRGVRGFVTDEFGNPIEGAILKIKGREIGFQTTKHGEYWRILLPGVYRIEAVSDGYAPTEVEFIVIEATPTQLNLTLFRSTVSVTSIGTDTDDDHRSPSTGASGVGGGGGWNYTGSKHRNKTGPRVKVAFGNPEMNEVNDDDFLLANSLPNHQVADVEPTHVTGSQEQTALHSGTSTTTEMQLTIIIHFSFSLILVSSLN